MIKEGIINLNKPTGLTSHDCIYAVRRLVDKKRVGHTGTLDPNATGVLPICIGSCARISEYTDMDLKTYDCTMALGLVTDTEDVWGTVLEDRRKALVDGRIVVTEAAVRATFARFAGQIEQYPPKYSAVRYDGRRLYEYARAGQEVAIKPRRAYIDSLVLTEINLQAGRVRFTVTCGKGTYIRAICHDAGEALGCGGVMTALTRTASGPFTLARAVSLERIKELTAQKGGVDTEEEINALILSPDEALPAFGRAVIKTAERARWFVNGGHIRLAETEIERAPRYQKEDAPFPIRAEYREAYCVYGHLRDERTQAGAPPAFLGVAFYNHDYHKLVADKVFRRIDEDI